MWKRILVAVLVMLFVVSVVSAGCQEKKQPAAKAEKKLKVALPPVHHP